VSAPCGQHAQQAGHRLTAAGAGDDFRGLGFRRFRCPDEQGPAGVEGDALAFLLRCGMAESIVPHRPQTTRQDVAQVAFDKLSAWDRVGAHGVAVGAVLVAEADVGIGNGNYARIANGGAANVGTEIFDDVLAAAEGFHVHAPILLPDGAVDGGQGCVFFGEVGKTVAEARAKDFHERRLMHQVVSMVLHTWNQRLHFHPHIHTIVPGAGINVAGKVVTVKNAKPSN
jgi:hypothetical protein